MPIKSLKKYQNIVNEPSVAGEWCHHSLFTFDLRATHFAFVLFTYLFLQHSLTTLEKDSKGKGMSLRGSLNDESRNVHSDLALWSFKGQ